MSRLVIEGAKPLSGTIAVHGAKNAVLPILAASVLCKDGISIIRNCPDLKDVTITIEILKYLGARVTRSGSTLTIDARRRLGSHIPETLMHELRSSVIFMGAIVARNGKAKISSPGGCELGPRPIDLHMKALTELGCNISEKKGYLHVKGRHIAAANLTLSFPSVGATENIMLASCFTSGVTVVKNVAKEPEIVDLANFLNAMGARICGAGTDTIAIHGVKRLHAADYTVMPDRIAATTYLCCAAVTGGSITLTETSDTKNVYVSVRDTGCGMDENTKNTSLKSSIRAIPRTRWRATDLALRWRCGSCSSTIFRSGWRAPPAGAVYSRSSCRKRRMEMQNKRRASIILRSRWKMTFVPNTWTAMPASAGSRTRTCRTKSPAVKSRCTSSAAAVF